MHSTKRKLDSLLHDYFMTLCLLCAHVQHEILEHDFCSTQIDPKWFSCFRFRRVHPIAYVFIHLYDNNQ